MDENNAKLSAIVQQLKNFRWVDLTHSFDADSPSRFPKSDTKASVKTIYTDEKNGYFINKYTFPS